MEQSHGRPATKIEVEAFTAIAKLQDENWELKERVRQFRANAKDVIVSLEWALERGVFECDCSPIYEWDTNAWNHKDTCSSFMYDHIEITLKDLKQLLSPSPVSHSQTNEVTK